MIWMLINFGIFPSRMMFSFPVITQGMIGEESIADGKTELNPDGGPVRFPE
jgi:hypothetical protein